VPLVALAAPKLVAVLPSFSSPASLGTGLAPVSVVIADLNGDGKPDVATANRLSGDVSVFLQEGYGVFPTRRDYVTGAEPSSLAVGDLNGDLRPDLVTSIDGDEGTVSVLTNLGGTFGAKRDYAIGMSPASVAIGDLVGDEALDVAVAVRDVEVSGAGGVAILENDGEGAFTSERLLYPLAADPASVAIGDLDGDGQADLATANSYAGTVSVLLNSGSGFQARADYATGDWAPSVTIGDLNADGRPDLVAGHFDKKVTVFLNAGGGRFGEAREHATGRNPTAVAIGDLNGDGAPDLATANYQSNTVSVLANWGEGDGSFVARRDFRTGDDPQAVAIGDLNGDSKPDLATVGEYTDGVFVLGNTSGLCTVPKVRLKTVQAATRAISNGLCALGGVRRAYSAVVAKGRVLSVTPRPGTVLPTGGQVGLIVSRGRRR
jgi:hypothetical protein